MKNNKLWNWYIVFSVFLGITFLLIDALQNYTNKTPEYIGDFMCSDLEVYTAQNEGFSADGKIDINLASQRILAEKLIGIGPVKAENIVIYREKMGGFYNKNELINVEGIGEKIFEQVKDLVYVQRPL